MDDQSLKQRKISFANSEHTGVIGAIFDDCRTAMPNLVGETEFETVVNAITTQVEANFKLRLLQYIDSIKKGKLHD